MTSGRSKVHSLCPSRDLYSPHSTFHFTPEVQKVRPIKKMGGRKPSVVGTVRLFHRKLNIVEELKQELEYQILSGPEPEVVSVTHDEFNKKMSQLDELVDQLTQSENVDAEDSLNDAACLTKLKMEVAQAVKKHELSFRNNSTRPSSATSSRINRIPVPSAPESPRVVQSMRDTRQQQINNLADQQSTSNPITIHRQVQSAIGVLQKTLIEPSVLMYRIIYSHQHWNKQTLNKQTLSLLSLHRDPPSDLKKSPIVPHGPPK